jgi:hypothetical protein
MKTNLVTFLYNSATKFWKTNMIFRYMTSEVSDQFFWKTRGIYGLTYLNLFTSISTCETVCERLRHVHKHSVVTYENNLYSLYIRKQLDIIT